jgi:hypothetical protein
MLASNSTIPATNEPSPGSYVCADADSPPGSHWTMYFWVINLIIEGIFFLLALYKAWQNRNGAGG